MTNYERIKNMSLEEMAISLMCPQEIDECFDKGETCDKKNCVSCTLEWLESEVDNGA